MKLDKEALRIDTERVCDEAVSFIKEKVDEFQREGIVFGLSGGLDSAVIAYLCTRALSKDKILALIMPEKDSSPETEKDAKFIAQQLGIKFVVENLTSKLEDFGIYSLLKIPGRILKRNLVRKGFHHYQKKTGESSFFSSLLGTKGKSYSELMNRSNAYTRIKHRLRMVTWYKYAELNNLLVIGCCNKTEELTGFFVKYGDGATDISPLAELYKTQVRQLASFLGVPKKIIEKTPSPDIMPGITDEYVLGLDYTTIDLILYALEKNISDDSIARQLNLNLKTINYVKELKKRSAHMREPPYVLSQKSKKL